MTPSSEAIAVNSTDKLVAHDYETQTARSAIDGWYARYVLGVLFIVYVFNVVDRQILAILAEDIKADLGISDAQLGFLFGTAFAIFYATFGIVLGRLADTWHRKKLISVGLTVWSLMTALSGLARSFVPLAACRFGVGMGEASASPAAFSIIYDYFSPKVRTTALAIYASGAYVGVGLGYFLGGTILEAWNNTWPDGSLAPFGLKGWQAAFIIVGLPGLLMALWVSTLREPVRGAGDGIVSKSHPQPFHDTAKVLITMLPIVNWWVLAKEGGNRKAIANNLAAMCIITFTSWGLIRLTDDMLQWVALGIGVYATVSWAQGLAARDPVVFGLIFKCRALIYLLLSGGAVTFMAVAIGFWSAPFLQRHHGVSVGEAGAVLGLSSGVMGFVGVILGGMLADKLRTYTCKGKLYVWFGGVTVSLLSTLLYLTANELMVTYVWIFVGGLAGTMAYGPLLSTINDLMLPRGRATASAFGLMVGTFVGNALGPYVAGHVSDVISATGVDTGESLRQAMLWSLLLPLVGMIPLFYAFRHIEADEASLLERARALGENI